MNERTIARFFVWVYCLSWAFDFRATEQGGSLIQFAFFGVTMASAFIVLALGWRHLFVVPNGWLILIWGVYLVSAVVVAKINGVPTGDFLRNFIQPLLMFLSMGVTQVAAGMGFSYKTVLHPMLIAGATNVLWRLFYTLHFEGKPIDEVRVEILSQCLPLLMGFMFAALALRRKFPFWPTVVGLLAIGSYVLSITRSAIFIVLAQIVAAGLCMWKARAMGLLPPGFVNRKAGQTIAGVSGLAILVVLLGVAVPSLAERWTGRLFHQVGTEYQTTDPSALTRLAETQAFYDIMRADPASFVYGKGLGHEYYWDERYFPELFYTYGDKEEFRDTFARITFPGHSIWTYAIFSSGFAGFFIYAAMLLGSTILAWKSVRHARTARDFPLDIAFLSFVTMIGFLSLSFTFNPFIERASTIAMGVAITFPQFLIMQAWREKKHPEAAPGFARIVGTLRHQS